MTPQSGFALAAQEGIKGEVLTDPLSTGIYSTDSSIYQILPTSVIFPKDNSDVQTIVELARTHQVPILARGGGTSLAGQTVCEAAVLDFTKYMHHVLEFNAEERWIRVQPGITRDEVNAYVKQAGLEFAPDPATSSRATIGGMIANNSSGTKSILYGKTSDHVLDLKVLLSDGSVHDIAAMSAATVESADERLKQLRKLAQEHRSEVETRFPKTMRRVSGYCLDDLLEEDPWHAYKIFIGSEGTLGLILEARINLVPLPRYKAVAVVQFAERMTAVRAVKTMLEFQPAAVEILSDTLLNYSRKNLETSAMCGFITGNPEAMQIVEFYSDTAEDISDRAQQMFTRLQSQGMGYAFDVYAEGKTYHNIWAIRQRGLGLLLGEPNDRRGIAFIEDAAIPVDVLPEYIERVLEICSQKGVEVTYYAHASVGVIHVRPILDMRQAGDITKMKEIAQEVFELVCSYGGAWSGEHGDGLVRSPFIKAYFGEVLYEAFRSVKQIFDPAGIMNPGKIIDAPPMDSNLRYGPEYEDLLVNSVYHYRNQVDFHTAVHQCTGIGACRKMQGGTMCPSYMVTRDETHSTRGRANALRLAMSGQLSNEGLADPVLRDAMDLCLSCKACKAECPSSVDMARLKSEVLQAQYKQHGIPLRDRFIRDSVQWAGRLSGKVAPFVNSIQSSGLFKKLFQSPLGLDHRRELPTYAKQKFTTWFKKNYTDQGHDRHVVLFADTYTNFHEPKIGIAAVQLIQKMGWAVHLAEGCCQRPRISHGFLERAKADGLKTCQHLDNLSDAPILVCEPGCTSAFTDDLPDLFDDETLGKRIQQRTMPIEQWVADQLTHSDIQLRPAQERILLHGHCHQKALFGTSSIHQILEHAGASVIEPDSGCCGMAGSFGYETEHYEVSKQVGERVLFDAIRSHPDALVVASGFSCRHQIAHFTQRGVVHWLNAIVVD